MFLNTDPDVLKKDVIPLSGTDARDMTNVIAGAASVASWMDWDLVSLHD